MAYEYTYFVGSLALVAVWIVFFSLRKDLRKEMLILSPLFGIVGLLIDPIYFIDWWNPVTLFGFVPAIEDFLAAGATGGIGAVVYSVLFNKSIKIKQDSKSYTKLAFIFLLFLLLHVGVFYIFNVHSFYACIIAFIIPTSIMLWERKDFIKSSLFSGTFLAVLSMPIYSFLELINPGWVQAFFRFDLLTGIIWFNVPFEDVVWWFLVGLFTNVIYKYWKNAKEVPYSG